MQLYLHAYISVHCKVIKIDGSGTGAKCTLLGTTNILLSIRNPGHLGRSENETKKSLQSKKAHTHTKKNSAPRMILKKFLQSAKLDNTWDQPIP